MKSTNKNVGIIGLCTTLLILAGSVPVHAQATAAKSVSPDLVGALVKQLKVTPEQATGGAGSLFGLAKTRLKPEEFTKVSAAVPGMDGLLSAAPKKDSSPLGSAASVIPGKSGGLASLAGQFKSLGLTPEMASKFVPVITDFVKGKGGPDVAKLLSGVLK